MRDKFGNELPTKDAQHVMPDGAWLDSLTDDEFRAWLDGTFGPTH